MKYMFSDCLLLDFDYNLNNSFEYNQNKVNQNTIENNKYEFNTMKRQKSPVIYDIGMDNYVFNEIQKAKYQGVFDPTSFGIVRQSFSVLFHFFVRR